MTGRVVPIDEVVQLTQEAAGKCKRPSSAFSDHFDLPAPFVKHQDLTKGDYIAVARKLNMHHYIPLLADKAAIDVDVIMYSMLVEMIDKGPVPNSEEKKAEQGVVEAVKKDSNFVTNERLADIIRTEFAQIKDAGNAVSKSVDEIRKNAREMVKTLKKELIAAKSLQLEYQDKYEYERSLVECMRLREESICSNIVAKEEKDKLKRNVSSWMGGIAFSGVLGYCALILSLPALSAVGVASCAGVGSFAVGNLLVQTFKGESKKDVPLLLKPYNSKKDYHQLAEREFQKMSEIAHDSREFLE